MSIFKYIILIFFTLILVLLEISYPLSPKGLSLTLVLMIILLFEVVKKRVKPGYAFLVAIFAGILLDLYSIFPPGLFFLSFLFTFYISYRFLLPRFNLNSSLSILIVSLIIVLIYQVLILIISYLFYFLNLSDLRIIFDGFYWSTVFQSIILNSLLVVMSFWIINLVRKLVLRTIGHHSL